MQGIGSRVELLTSRHPVCIDLKLGVAESSLPAVCGTSVKFGGFSLGPNGQVSTSQLALISILSREAKD